MFQSASKSKKIRKTYLPENKKIVMRCLKVMRARTRNYFIFLSGLNALLQKTKLTKVCAKTIDTLCKIPWFLSLTWIYRYELTGGDSDNYKDIFQTVSISITKIYNRKKYRWNFADFWIANVHTKKIIPACSPFLAESEYVSCDLIGQNGEPREAKIYRGLRKFVLRDIRPVFAWHSETRFSFFLFCILLLIHWQ